MDFYELLEAQNKTLIPIEFYFKSFDETFSMQLHSHDTFELMYAESGNFEVLISENGKQETFCVNEGGFTFVPPALPHKLIVTKTAKIYNLEFSKADLPQGCMLNLFAILSSLDSYRQMKRDGQKLLILNDSENLIRTMTLIHQILKVRPDTADRFYQLQALTLNLFIDIGNCYLHSKHNANNLYLHKILYIIHKECFTALTPKILAEKIKISESYLFRIFKKNMNCNITYYINQIRVEKAKQLLIKTEHPIVDIGISVGFNSRQYFCRTFSLFTGMSPTEFRKKAKKSDYTIVLRNKNQVFWET